MEENEALPKGSGTDKIINTTVAVSNDKNNTISGVQCSRTRRKLGQGPARGVLNDGTP
jgi:hypothetical protein